MPAMNSMIWFGKPQLKKMYKNQDTTIMKAKYLLIALLTLTFAGCDDNTGGLGLGMFPGDDQNINGRLSTFDVTTQSIPAGRIYAKTSVGYLGKFTDATFGTYRASFLTELHCPQGLIFPEVYQAYDAKGNKVAPDSPDAVRATGIMVPEGTTYDGKEIGNLSHTGVSLIYDKKGFFGDSVTACRLSIYELNKKLDKKTAYYTDIDPTEYYNPNDLLGRKAYTAVDLSINSSKRDSLYAYSVYVSMDKDGIGKRILDASRKYGANLYKYFLSDVLQGIYVNSDYGDGTVLYIDQVQLDVVYNYYVTDSITGLKLKKKYAKDKNGKALDSLTYSGRTFASTKEIIQANQMINNTDKINELINTPAWTYLKTPAGIFTEATLPISEIETKLKGDTLNAVKFTFTNYNQESDKKFGMKIPDRVLLLKKNDKHSFFANNKLNDNISSFITTRSSSTNQYVFTNITKLITSCIEAKDVADATIKKSGSIKIKVEDEASGDLKEITAKSLDEWKEATQWDKVVLIPVSVVEDTSDYGTTQVISIQHDLAPGYVRLKGGKAGITDPDHRLKIEVVSTNFNGTK